MVQGSLEWLGRLFAHVPTCFHSLRDIKLYRKCQSFGHFTIGIGQHMHHESSIKDIHPWLWMHSLLSSNIRWEQARRKQKLDLGSGKHEFYFTWIYCSHPTFLNHRQPWSTGPFLLIIQQNCTYTGSTLKTPQVQHVWLFTRNKHSPHSRMPAPYWWKQEIGYEGTQFIVG